MSLPRLSKYAIILVLLPALFTSFFPGKIVLVQAVCFYLLTYVYWLKRSQWHTEEFDGGIIFVFVFVWSAVTYVRGFGNIDWAPDLYNQLAGLFFMCFTFPILLYASNTSNLKYIYKGFLSYGIVICLVTAIIPPSDAMMTFQHNMYIIYGFVFCIPYVKRKHKLLILLAVLIICIYDMERRSVFVNASVSIFILLFFKFVKNKFLRNSLFVTFIVSPLIILVLGATGTYNIFESMSDIDSSIELGEKKRSLSTDSRTGIYLDVLMELDKKSAYLFGLGGNGKTDTHILDSYGGSEYEEMYKYGRPGTESGMLNNIQYGGAVGLVVFSLLYIIAAFRATSKSNNEYMRMLGMFVAFKFLYSFIEDRIGAQASTFYLFLWIGMCYNTYFRTMTELQIKQYFNQVFK